MNIPEVGDLVRVEKRTFPGEVNPPLVVGIVVSVCAPCLPDFPHATCDVEIERGRNQTERRTFRVAQLCRA